MVISHAIIIIKTNLMGENIIQWNINSYYSQLEYLKLIIADFNPSVICLQETNFKNNHCAKINQYNHVFKNRINNNYACGGVTTYIHNSIFYEEIQLQTNLEAVATKVLLSLGYLTICNLYLPNSYDFQTQEIIELINQLPLPFIIVGDLNAHSLSWGSHKLCRRGKKIEKILEDPSIVLLNTGNVTHINNSSKTFSAIDLSLCSVSIAHTTDWTTLNDSYGSDHIPINITFPKAISQQIHVEPKWKFYQADWDKYRKIIYNTLNENSWTLEQVNTTIDKKVSNFVNIIINAANLSIPKSSGNQPKRHTPWWNEQCQNALNASKNAFNRYKRHPNTTNELEFKRLRAITRKTLKEQKKIVLD